MENIVDSVVSTKKRKRKQKEPLETEPVKKPKKVQASTNLYGEPSNPVYKEFTHSSVNQILWKEGNIFYMHPLSEECVLPVVLQETVDYGQAIVCVNRLNLTTNIPCMHCLVNNGVRVPLVKDYNYSTGQWLVFGSVCSLECAMAYECEHPSSDTHSVRMLINKFAREYYGYSKPVEASPPRILYTTFGGFIDPKEKSETLVHTYIHEANFVTYPMLMECQSMDQYGKISVSAPTDKQRQTKISNIRGLVMLKKKNTATQ